MLYFLESVGLWDNTLLANENHLPIPIILKKEDLENNLKVEHQEKRTDKIHTWKNDNIKSKDYISYICLGHIQHNFQNIKTDSLAYNLWE